MPEACDLDILCFKGDSHSTIAADIWNWNEHWSSSLQVQPLPKEGHSSIENWTVCVAAKPESWHRLFDLAAKKAKPNRSLFSRNWLSVNDDEPILAELPRQGVAPTRPCESCPTNDSIHLPSFCVWHVAMKMLVCPWWGDQMAVCSEPGQPSALIISNWRCVPIGALASAAKWFWQLSLKQHSNAFWCLHISQHCKTVFTIVIESAPQRSSWKTFWVHWCVELGAPKEAQFSISAEVGFAVFSGAKQPRKAFLIHKKTLQKPTSQWQKWESTLILDWGFLLCLFGPFVCWKDIDRSVDPSQKKQAKLVSLGVFVALSNLEVLGSMVAALPHTTSAFSCTPIMQMCSVSTHMTTLCVGLACLALFDSSALRWSALHTCGSVGCRFCWSEVVGFELFQSCLFWVCLCAECVLTASWIHAKESRQNQSASSPLQMSGIPHLHGDSDDWWGLSSDTLHSSKHVHVTLQSTQTSTKVQLLHFFVSCSWWFGSGCQMNQMQTIGLHEICKWKFKRKIHDDNSCRNKSQLKSVLSQGQLQIWSTTDWSIRLTIGMTLVCCYTICNACHFWLKIIGFWSPVMLSFQERHCCQDGLLWGRTSFVSFLSVTDPKTACDLQKEVKHDSSQFPSSVPGQSSCTLRACVMLLNRWNHHHLHAVVAWPSHTVSVIVCLFLFRCNCGCDKVQHACWLLSHRAEQSLTALQGNHCLLAPFGSWGLQGHAKPTQAIV